MEPHPHPAGRPPGPRLLRRGVREGLSPEVHGGPHVRQARPHRGGGQGQGGERRQPAPGGRRVVQHCHRQVRGHPHPRRRGRPHGVRKHRGRERDRQDGYHRQEWEQVSLTAVTKIDGQDSKFCLDLVHQYSSSNHVSVTVFSSKPFHERTIKFPPITTTKLLQETKELSMWFERGLIVGGSKLLSKVSYCFFFILP